MTRVSGVKKSPFPLLKWGRFAVSGHTTLSGSVVSDEEIACEDQIDFDETESPSVVDMCLSSCSIVRS